MKQNVILDIGMAFDVSTFQQLVDSSKYNILYIGESEFVQKLSQHVSSEKIEYYQYQDIYTFENEELEYE